MLDVLGVEGLVLDEGQDSSRSTDHNVWTVILQHVLVLLDTYTTKEDGDLDVVKVLAETLVLFVDLEGQLPRKTTKGVRIAKDPQQNFETSIFTLVMIQSNIQNALPLLTTHVACISKPLTIDTQ